MLLFNFNSSSKNWLSVTWVFTGIFFKYQGYVRYFRMKHIFKNIWKKKHTPWSLWQKTGDLGLWSPPPPYLYLLSGTLKSAKRTLPKEQSLHITENKIILNVFSSNKVNFMFLEKPVRLAICGISHKMVSNQTCVGILMLKSKLKAVKSWKTRKKSIKIKDRCFYHF